MVVLADMQMLQQRSGTTGQPLLNWLHIRDRTVKPVRTAFVEHVPLIEPVELGQLNQPMRQLWIEQLRRSGRVCRCLKAGRNVANSTCARNRDQ